MELLEKIKKVTVITVSPVTRPRRKTMCWECGLEFGTASNYRQHLQNTHEKAYEKLKNEALKKEVRLIHKNNT